MGRMRKGKTVWILGSGFSKPLGGPTLPQLLSHIAFQDAEVRYPDVFKDEVVHRNTYAVRFLYHYGTRFKQGPMTPLFDHVLGEPLWEHAEEFLDQLDAAALDESRPSAKQLRAIIKSQGPICDAIRFGTFAQLPEGSSRFSVRRSRWTAI
jgi:hypothetical protein